MSLSRVSRPYLALLAARFRVLLQYRAAAIAGFGTQLFWGMIRVMIFEAFYRSSSRPQPMAFEEVVTYVWLGQALLTMLPWNLEDQMRELMRSGNVAYELLRPVDLYTFWYCRSVALRSAPAVLRSIPMFVLAGLFFGMSAPASPASAAMCALSILCCLALSAAITTLLSIGLLWTVAGEGISRIGFAAVILFSGNIIPIPLFPDWLRWLAELLPFRGLADTPFRLYLGHIPAAQALGPLLHQVAWAVALVVAGRMLLARGVRRMVVQGG